MALFDVAAVNERIEAALRSTQFDEARQIYTQELMDWADYYNENLAEEPPTSSEVQQAKISIPRLWIAYANMEVKIKQFKKALQVFDDALNEKLARDSFDVYIAYSDFCKMRGRLANEQKVYLKGVCSQMAQEDIDKLWMRFLDAFNSNSNQEKKITMKELYEAAVKEQTEIADNIRAPSPWLLGELGAEIDQSSTEAIVASESKAEDIMPGTQSSSSQEQLTASTASSNGSDLYDQLGDAMVIETQNRVDFAESKEDSSQPNEVSEVMVDVDDITGLTPEMLVKVYHRKPPMLFSAQTKEPLCSGVTKLDQNATKELEDYLGCSLQSIIEGHSLPIRTEYYLSILEGLWMQQALKERHFDYWFMELMQQNRQREMTLKHQHMELVRSNPTEARKFEVTLKRNHDRSLVQREVLHAIVNKTMYFMLLEQQRALLSINFPRFNKTVIQKLERCVAATKMSMSSKIGNAFDLEPELVSLIGAQSILVCAALSLRLGIYSTSNNEGGIKRMSSVESDISGDWKEDQMHNTTEVSRKRLRIDNNGEMEPNMRQAFVVPSVSALVNPSIPVASTYDIPKKGPVPDSYRSTGWSRYPGQKP